MQITNTGKNKVLDKIELLFLVVFTWIHIPLPRIKIFTHMVLIYVTMSSVELLFIK